MEPAIQPDPLRGVSGSLTFADDAPDVPAAPVAPIRRARPSLAYRLGESERAAGRHRDVNPYRFPTQGDEAERLAAFGDWRDGYDFEHGRRLFLHAEALHVAAKGTHAAGVETSDQPEPHRVAGPNAEPDVADPLGSKGSGVLTFADDYPAEDVADVTLAADVERPGLVAFVDEAATIPDDVLADAALAAGTTGRVTTLAAFGPDAALAFPDEATRGAARLGLPPLRLSDLPLARIAVAVPPGMPEPPPDRIATAYGDGWSARAHGAARETGPRGGSARIWSAVDWLAGWDDCDVRVRRDDRDGSPEYRAGLAARMRGEARETGPKGDRLSDVFDWYAGWDSPAVERVADVAGVYPAGSPVVCRPHPDRLADDPVRVCTGWSGVVVASPSPFTRVVRLDAPSGFDHMVELNTYELAPAPSGASAWLAEVLGARVFARRVVLGLVVASMLTAAHAQTPAAVALGRAAVHADAARAAAGPEYVAAVAASIASGNPADAEAPALADVRLHALSSLVLDSLDVTLAQIDAALADVEARSAAMAERLAAETARADVAATALSATRAELTTARAETAAARAETATAYARGETAGRNAATTRTRGALASILDRIRGLFR